MLKIVKGATKPKEAAPKAKYIEPILASTYDAGRDFENVMDAIAKVLDRPPGSASAYKALIVVHIMIREGAENVTLKYLGRNPETLDVDRHVTIPDIKRYRRYLYCRAMEFKDTKIDFVRYKNRQGNSRLHDLTVSKGLLRECESVITQIEHLLECHYDETSVENDVILMVFRLLVHDLLSFFQVLNEGVINLLEHFFELSKPDAERGLEIYRAFTRLTSKCIAYLKVAKNLEYKTKLHVPNIKHAPTSLVSSLEMYLSDPDFEQNRRQYVAEKQAHQEVRRSFSGRSSNSTLPLRRPSTQNNVQRNVSAPEPQRVQTFTQPQQQFDLLSGTQQSQQNPASTTVNPFWQSQNQQAQQEALAQVQAARIQLQEGQAQLHMQQLQLQQQQLAAQAQQQQQQQQQQPFDHYAAASYPTQQVQQTPSLGFIDTGFDFGQGMTQAPLQASYTGPSQTSQPSQPPTPPPSQYNQYTPQPQVQPYDSLLPMGPQQPASDAHYNPFKRASLENQLPTQAQPQYAQSTGTNPFSRQSSQAQRQQTGTNPFRVSMI